MKQKHLSEIDRVMFEKSDLAISGIDEISIWPGDGDNDVQALRARKLRP